MIETKLQGNRFPVQAAIVIVLLLTILPLALFILIQFIAPAESASSAGVADETASGTAPAAERRVRRMETRTVRQEAKTTHAEAVPHGMAPDPDMADSGFQEDISVVGVGAVVPNAPRSKRATPYPPGTVPGDSGIMVQYAGSPDDMASGPQPPQDDPWGGRTMAPIPPSNMGGIGGVRRIDPDDPFFQQDIPNPFTR